MTSWSVPTSLENIIIYKILQWKIIQKFFSQNQNIFIMHNSLEKRNKFPQFRHPQSNSVCILKDFANKLEQQMRQIRSMNRKGKKNTSLYNKIALPNIHQNKRNQINQSIDDKLNEMENKIKNMEKDCQDFNNNIKLKNAFEQINDSIDSSCRSTYSISKQNRCQPRQPIVQPLIIYPTTIIASPMANFPFNCNPQIPNFYQKQGKGASCQNDSQSSESSRNNISKPRRIFLKRKFRIISLGVFFIFLFKTYSKTVTYKKYLKFKQVENKFDDKQSIQNQIFQKILKFKIYDNFFDICKKVELKTKQQGYEVQIPYEDQQIIINVKACERFISAFLDHIYDVVKSNQFKQFILINAQFMTGTFPLSKMFLIQQLRLMNFNQSGCLKLTPEMSKMLMINYFFIKIILYQFLCKKHLMAILKKAFHKKYTQKKFILLYGKKLVVSLILLYQALNSIFFNNMKKKSVTYDALPSNLKPTPLKNIQYHFSISYEDIMETQKHLIKKINCSTQLVSAFMQIFQEIWDKIKKIIEYIYTKAEHIQRSSLEQIKQRALKQPFPKRGQLESFLKKKTGKKSNDKNQSQQQSQDESEQDSKKSASTKKARSKKKLKNKK